ncbi:putative kinase-like protein TMKL1 [Benincasa hispida]|uniref:putative kinase-like protein TMKL1 n=1 Tax=Benincasa hispida TaxID=102211 RepID=UPI0018FF478C|nr:putative kinase-like protein TMKL1 [Benincasa hispida]
MLKLILLVASATIFILLLISIFLFRLKLSKNHDIENPSSKKNKKTEHRPPPPPPPELTTFEGGEYLTIDEILEAPGEVIGKSHYGTLYKATLQSTQTTRLLRFLRPAASGGDDQDDVVRLLGSIRHRNLVPLLGFYAGGRGEKLLVHPFYEQGNLAEFIRVSETESKNWEAIYKIAIGIAKALDHLHNGLQRPIPHGNLKSKNILLDRNLDPHISDFGLHLLLNAAATREMLQVSAAAGYKAPELIKMTDADERTDVYSYGKILLELLSAKEPTIRNPVATGVSEERILRCLVQIGEACCRSSPNLRLDFREVIAKIEEIGRIEMD